MYRKLKLFLMVFVETLIQLVWYFFWIILLVMAAFKAHAAVNVWRGREIRGDQAEAEGMDQFGKLTARDDLPPDARENVDPSLFVMRASVPYFDVSSRRM